MAIPGSFIQMKLPGSFIREYLKGRRYVFRFEKDVRVNYSTFTANRLADK
jgi:hypothetical protein